MNLKEKYSAVLVAVNTGTKSLEKTHEQLLEIESLAGNLNIVVKYKFIQNLEVHNSQTLIGKGKLEEIRTFIIENNIEYVIFDEELSPKHFKNLSKEFDCQILCRTLLILKIFTLRAETVQAKTQVELAHYQHLLPRLSKMWTHLSKQRGGTANMKGTGEKELETDRRLANNKIFLLKEKLKKIEIQNNVRKKNQKNLVRIALVGYTNAGKSSLINKLTNSNVLVADKLFATLDSSVRRTYINNIPVLISDTVGFIRKLPHNLIECFKSTLAQVLDADLLLHVIDVSNTAYNEHIYVVNNTLKEIGANNIPTINIYNKVDLISDKKNIVGNNISINNNSNYIFISTNTKQDIIALKNYIYPIVKNFYMKINPNVENIVKLVNE